MKKKLQKSGDSRVVVLPKIFLDMCEIEEEVEISIENKKIVISRPIGKNKLEQEN